MQDGAPHAIPADSLLGDAQDLPPDAFRKKHGDHFLLGSGVPEEVPAGPRATQIPGIEMDRTMTASVGQFVYPLRRTARSIGAFVSIGRTQNNDVVLVHQTVSRFHAFVKAPEGGAPCIQDAGSTNGTTVNGKRVPPQAEGAPTELRRGDDVRIGSIDFTYLDAEGLQDFLRMMR